MQVRAHAPCARAGRACKTPCGMVYCQKAKQHGGEAGAVDFERDYIMRMIQMMGDFFRRIADMVDDRERALLIDAQARQHCGMPLATAEALEPDMLAELLPPAQRFVMSELLHTKGRACASLPAAHREALLLQSLRLLSTLNGDQFAQRAASFRRSSGSSMPGSPRPT